MKSLLTKFLSDCRVLVMAGLVSSAFAAHAGSPLELSHRNLFSLCAPMDAVVEHMTAGPARKIGLTSSAIENKLESKLREAQLLEAETSQYLSMQVNLLDPGDSYSVELALNRYVADMGYGIGGFVAIWTGRVLGRHGGKSGPVLVSVEALADEFLGYYLQVNEAECPARKDTSGD